MVLKPLEFSECIADTPWFRQNLHEHEVALEDAYKSIKNIETQCRELISCTRSKSSFFIYSLFHFFFPKIALIFILFDKTVTKF